MDIKKSVKAFNALSQITRLNIIKRLVKEGKKGLCPCDLVEEFKLTNANLSFHLKELENAGLVKKEKIGQFIHYRANCEIIKELIGFLIEDCSGHKCKEKNPEGKND